MSIEQIHALRTCALLRLIDLFGPDVVPGPWTREASNTVQKIAYQPLALPLRTSHMGQSQRVKAETWGFQNPCVLQ